MYFAIQLLCLSKLTYIIYSTPIYVLLLCKHFAIRDLSIYTVVINSINSGCISRVFLCE